MIGEIAALSRKRLALYRKTRDIRDRIRVIRAQLIIKIGKAKDEKGKIVYSNEQLREAALTLELELPTQPRADEIPIVH